jgi:hypothetical protein
MPSRIVISAVAFGASLLLAEGTVRAEFLTVRSRTIEIAPLFPDDAGSKSSHETCPENQPTRSDFPFSNNLWSLASSGFGISPPSDDVPTTRHLPIGAITATALRLCILHWLAPERSELVTARRGGGIFRPPRISSRLGSVGPFSNEMYAMKE